MTGKALLIAALCTLAAALAVPAAGVAATPTVTHGQFRPLSYHWPVKPFDRQHPIRGGFGDPRTLSRDEPFGWTGPNESGAYSFHNGIDIVAAAGTAVYPVVSGWVAKAEADEIVIDTYDGRAFQYYHLSKARDIQRGAKVVVDHTVLGWIRHKYGHVHLAEIDNHLIHNPLDYGHLEPYDDSTRPVATELYLDNGPVPSPLAGRTIHPGDPLAVAAYDPPAMDVPGEWSGLPQAPALVKWRMFHAGTYSPWHVVVDFRETEPTPREFWSVYARGSYQNHPVFDHRLFDNPGRYLYRLDPPSELQPGLYRLQVQVADIRHNYSTTTWALQTQASASSQHRRRYIRTLPSYCSDTAPCHLRKGRYRLGPKSVLPGLRLTLPRGWSGTENWQGALHLIPAGHPNDALVVWTDLVAVKSTGPGHGTTVLTNVGTTPTDLLSWLTSNPDFMVVSTPTATKIAGRIPATTLTVGVSASANYGDPGCPSNPRCADFFTSPLWGQDFYSIGYPEEAQFSLAVIKRGTKEHTLFVLLDAINDSDMAALRAATHSVIASFWLPKTVTPG
jgi:hypothetical protein